MHWRYRLLQGLALLAAGTGIALLHARPAGTAACAGAETCRTVRSAPSAPAPPADGGPAAEALRSAAAPRPAEEDLRSATAGAPPDPGGEAVPW